VARTKQPSAPVGYRALDIKTVLGIAGTIIIALAGLAWGLIARDYNKQSDTNGKQWDLIKGINDAHIKLEADTFYLKRDMEDSKRERIDYEARLRALERR